MLRPRIEICLAAVCCAVACGDRPDLPGSTTPNASSAASMGSASSGGSGNEVTVLGQPSQPTLPQPTEPEPSSAPDAGPPPIADEGAVGELPEPLGPAVLVSACTVRDTSGCYRLYIAVADEDADSCLQLSLDNCNDTTRAGFAVDVPLSWRFGSGFVGPLGSTCIPRASFLARDDTAIVSATGSITWNEDTRQPSEIVLDVTLQPSNAVIDNDPIRLVNSELVEPLVECGG